MGTLRRQQALPSPAVEGRPPTPLFLAPGGLGGGESSGGSGAGGGNSVGVGVDGGGGSGRDAGGAGRQGSAARGGPCVAVEVLDAEERSTAAALLDAARRVAAGIKVKNGKRGKMRESSVTST